MQTRCHDEALHSGEGGQVSRLDDGLTTLGRSEEEHFALELLAEVLVDDLHPVGERPLGSSECRDFLLASDAPCGELEVNELRDRGRLIGFAGEDGAVVRLQLLAEGLLGDGGYLGAVGVGDEGEVAFSHPTLLEPST